VFALEASPLILKFLVSALAGGLLYPLLLVVFARGHVRELIAEIAPVLPPKLAMRLLRKPPSSGAEP
jgi:hypothetical protein